MAKSQLAASLEMARFDKSVIAHRVLDLCETMDDLLAASSEEIEEQILKGAKLFTAKRFRTWLEAERASALKARATHASRVESAPSLANRERAVAASQSTVANRPPVVDDATAGSQRSRWDAASEVVTTEVEHSCADVADDLYKYMRSMNIRFLRGAGLGDFKAAHPWHKAGNGNGSGIKRLVMSDPRFRVTVHENGQFDLHLRDSFRPGSKRPREEGPGSPPTRVISMDVSGLSRIKRT
mmetsp:Transcript_5332/g.16134  ORF Transcript_5332/g.16134 Transcript_5332/m.16134 type:complete len:240 (+) Transcript_5332:36-755(+)